MVASRTVRPVRFYGDDVYNYLVRGPARRARTGFLPRRGHQPIPVQIQNDGEDVDSFTFRRCGGSDSLFTVRYLSGYYDITAKVIAGQWGSSATWRQSGWRGAPSRCRSLSSQVNAPRGTGIESEMTFVSVTERELRHFTIPRARCAAQEATAPA